MRSKKLPILFITILVFLTLFTNPREAFAVVQNLNGQTGQTQTFQNDSNVTMSSANNIHSLGWLGLLPISRGGTGANSFSLGSLLFSNGTSISQNNSNLFWDNTNNRLGIGTSSPASTLDVNGNTSVTGNLNVTGNITGNITATNLVPYTGATGNVNLGSHNLTAEGIASNGDATINTLTIGMGGGSISSNTAIGKDALLNNTAGFYNTAVGQSALAANTNTKNTALGARTLLNNSSGDENTALGALVLESNTTGGLNTGVGGEALFSNTTGARNTALGHQALKNNNGDDNVAIGFYSLLQNASGSGNIAIGERAGFWANGDSGFLTNPISSIFIGNRTRSNNNDANSIVIGNEVEGAGSNTSVIGNSAMTDIYFGSSSANANTHAKKMYLGSSSVPGCIIMGDTSGGVGYITLNSGVLTVSSTPPNACQ